MRTDHRLDLGHSQTGGVHQRVEPLNPRQTGLTAPDVERGPSRRRHRQGAHAGELSGRQGVVMDDEHLRRAAVGVDQFGGKRRLNPLGAQEGRRRQPGDHAGPA